MARPSSYPAELCKRAVRMVTEVRGDYPNESAALSHSGTLGRCGGGSRTGSEKHGGADPLGGRRSTS